MFKTLFQSKFKFANEFISPLAGVSGQGSTSIGNLIINYPAYRQQKEEINAQRMKILSDKYKRNFEAVSVREKEIVELSHWEFKKNEAQSTSLISKTLEFPEEYLALEFIALTKDKCDEIDHHPSWTYTADVRKGIHKIQIELTSHFAKNNVTYKDYELAAFLTYEYDQLLNIYSKRNYRKLVGVTLSTLLILFIFSKTTQKYQDWNNQRALKSPIN